MKTIQDDSNEIAKQIEKLAETFNIDKNNQFKIQILPIISNAIYARENDLLEQERFQTIIKLSRVLNDEEIIKAIDGLGYGVSLKK